MEKSDVVVLTLKRKYLKSGYTIGVLSLDGVTRFCDTLEDPVRDLNHDGDLDDPGEGKIAGVTAIPYGEYDVILYQSPKFGRRLPMLLGVKHFDYILMHAGATAKNTLGCVLVGDNDHPGHLINGGYYERKLVEFIEAAQIAGKKIKIRIS